MIFTKTNKILLTACLTISFAYAQASGGEPLCANHQMCDAIEWTTNENDDAPEITSKRSDSMEAEVKELLQGKPSIREIINNKDESAFRLFKSIAPDRSGLSYVYSSKSAVELPDEIVSNNLILVIYNQYTGEGYLHAFKSVVDNKKIRKKYARISPAAINLIARNNVSVIKEKYHTPGDKYKFSNISLPGIIVVAGKLAEHLNSEKIIFYIPELKIEAHSYVEKQNYSVSIYNYNEQRNFEFYPRSFTCVTYGGSGKHRRCADYGISAQTPGIIGYLQGTGPRLGGISNFNGLSHQFAINVQPRFYLGIPYANKLGRRPPAGLPNYYLGWSAYIDVAAPGSPADPVYANLYMKKINGRLLSNIQYNSSDYTGWSGFHQYRKTRKTSRHNYSSSKAFSSPVEIIESLASINYGQEAPAREILRLGDVAVNNYYKELLTINLTQAEQDRFFRVADSVKNGYMMVAAHDQYRTINSSNINNFSALTATLNNGEYYNAKNPVRSLSVAKKNHLNFITAHIVTSYVSEITAVTRARTITHVSRLWERKHVTEIPGGCQRQPSAHHYPRSENDLGIWYYYYGDWSVPKTAPLTICIRLTSYSPYKTTVQVNSWTGREQISLDFAQTFSKALEEMINIKASPIKGTLTQLKFNNYKVNEHLITLGSDDAITLNNVPPPIRNIFAQNTLIAENLYDDRYRLNYILTSTVNFRNYPLKHVFSSNNKFTRHYQRLASVLANLHDKRKTLSDDDFNNRRPCTPGNYRENFRVVRTIAQDRDLPGFFFPWRSNETGENVSCRQFIEVTADLMAHVLYHGYNSIVDYEINVTTSTPGISAHSYVPAHKDKLIISHSEIGEAGTIAVVENYNIMKDIIENKGKLEKYSETASKQGIQSLSSKQKCYYHPHGLTDDRQKFRCKAIFIYKSSGGVISRVMVGLEKYDNDGIKLENLDTDDFEENKVKWPIEW